MEISTEIDGAKSRQTEDWGRYPDRAKRLHSFISDKRQVLNRFPLLVEMKVPEILFHNLQIAVSAYLFDTLTEAYPNEKFEMDEAILSRCSEKIEKLSNLTPNGLFLPKRENVLSFNLVHKAMARIIRHFALERKANTFHLPVNIRIVNGEPREWVDTRPRASTKLHSDIWAGESTNAIMAFIPVAGDMVNNGIENMEPPIEFSHSFLRPLSDYNLGAELEQDCIPYDCPMKKGNLYLTDPFLLHRTRKRAKGLRLSIDFRMRAIESVPTDGDELHYRDKDYYHFEEWMKVGTEKFLCSNEYLNGRVVETEKKEAKNEYATRVDYRTV